MFRDKYIVYLSMLCAVFSHLCNFTINDLVGSNPHALHNCLESRVTLAAQTDEIGELRAFVALNTDPFVFNFV